MQAHGSPSGPRALVIPLCSCELSSVEVSKMEHSPKCLLGVSEGPAKATKKHRAQHGYAFTTRTNSDCDFSPH